MGAIQSDFVLNGKEPDFPVAYNEIQSQPCARGYSAGIWMTP